MSCVILCETAGTSGSLPCAVHGMASALHNPCCPCLCLVALSQMLLATEGVDLHFTDAAVREVARLAEALNRATENIGARRLAAVLERVVEGVSFGAPELVARVRGGVLRWGFRASAAPAVVVRLPGWLHMQACTCACVCARTCVLSVVNKCISDTCCCHLCHGPHSSHGLCCTSRRVVRGRSATRVWWTRSTWSSVWRC